MGAGAFGAYEGFSEIRINHIGHLVSQEKVSGKLLTQRKQRLHYAYFAQVSGLKGSIILVA